MKTHVSYVFPTEKLHLHIPNGHIALFQGVGLLGSLGRSHVGLENVLGATGNSAKRYNVSWVQRYVGTTYLENGSKIWDGGKCPVSAMIGKKEKNVTTQKRSQKQDLYLRAEGP